MKVKCGILVTFWSSLLKSLTFLFFHTYYRFSFPMIQSALNVGTLVTWTKSFNCPGVVGTDAVEHLNSAIKRQGGSLAQEIEVVGECKGVK